MHRFLTPLLLFASTHFASATTVTPPHQEVNFSMVISGGVSLGAYEAGYNWAIIKMLSTIREDNRLIKPNLKSVSGASAGAINALLSSMYWCQEESIPLHNTINDNLFYETWVNLGIEDLAIRGSDPHNKSSLFSRRGLEKKAQKIHTQLDQPIFRRGCEVPLGIAVTKVTPIVEEIHGIKVKNQNFSVPLIFKESHGKGIVVNKTMPKDNAFYISIPHIKEDKDKIFQLLFASGAFPGAFQQVKLDYAYKGKSYSNYFIDGGLYDNVPLDLAIALNKDASTFFFMDPSNMRKETSKQTQQKAENPPLGFIDTNLLPLFNSFDIMQSMKLYEAINKNFRNNSKKRLVLSSRFHPLTGKFLTHFGAFLDQNFRIYDYYVGVYDAIYHMADAVKRYHPKKFRSVSKIAMMNYLADILKIKQHPEAYEAYQLLLNTEFHHTHPKTTNRFSAIYNAFDLSKPDATRYDNEAFKRFLKKLDMRYLTPTPNGFLAYVKKDIDTWYKKPLRFIVNRITTIENDAAKVDTNHSSVATATAIGAWTASSFLKEKHGFEFLPLDVPHDEGKEGLRTLLRLLPGEIATDIHNGGISLSYLARYYTESSLIHGFEAKASMVFIPKEEDFVRLDIDAFHTYNDLLKVGAGVSLFGNTEGTFYEEESAYGFNTYIDILDIFRLSYVHRKGDRHENSYLYFGIENLPSLIYWLSR